MSHLDHILTYAPEILSGQSLDLGSGKGDFLIEARKRGIEIHGIEPSQEYIKITEARAREAGVSVSVTRGVAESLPDPDGSLQFINITEVIEHVEDPKRLLEEVARVLKPGGKAYLSVPNRFGFRDQHFKLYFLNWVPRSLADTFISVFGKHKDYSDRSAGRQRLADMHYYTYSQIQSLVRTAGLSMEDIRLKRLRKEYSGIRYAAILPIYLIARTMYFDAFHVLVKKPDQERRV